MQLYEIGKLIGTGSSGDVFLCKHKTDKNYNYALKRIKTFEIDEKQRENIENQLKILQKLRHINIVSYKDSFTDKEGNLCIVMVYCQLGDMHSKIKLMKEKGKNFTESQILDWVTQTALAIYYLHNQKILHRDLKTQNLFLKRDKRNEDDRNGQRKEDKKDDRYKQHKDERIKLGDFGIAKVLDTTQDLARTCIGTPYYMAPQIFKYKPYSYKSDIWSLGIIIYELCNLRLPFEAQHYNALAMKILKGTYPSIMPTYSKQLRDLITSMLSKKPQDRPNIIDILNKPFIRTRTEKYMNELFTRTVAPLDVDDIFLDTLKEQAVLLEIQTGEEQGIKKYPSSKDLEKKQFMSSKSYFNKRSQEEEHQIMVQYHSKRKSTFQKESKKGQETSASSFKGMGFDMSDEKDAFVNHKNEEMMEKMEKRNSLDLKKIEYSKANQRRFKIEEDYSMQEENNDDEVEMQEISEDIRQNEESDEQLQSTFNLEEEEQVPESYNKSYYRLLDKIKVLKHRCETALGSNKYLRAYNAVNNGANKAAILDILTPQMIGYWHLIDQIMFNQSILKTLPKN